MQTTDIGPCTHKPPGSSLQSRAVPVHNESPGGGRVHPVTAVFAFCVGGLCTALDRRHHLVFQLSLHARIPLPLNRSRRKKVPNTMPIPDHRISDRTSFQSTTGSPRDTAALYFHKQLDPVYDSALLVAGDFLPEPHLYTNISDGKVVGLLAALRSQCGSNELLPSQPQRLDIYAPIFGSPGSSANFDKLRDDLIAAATAFSERVFDTGVDMLRERVRTAQRPLRDYLLALTGASTDWSAQHSLDNLAENVSFAILRDTDIGTIFGIGATLNPSWPYSEDSNADKLLEEITNKIGSSTRLTRQQASSRQRLAARGAEAIASVIEYTENRSNINDDIRSLTILITRCYTWGAAKAALTR